MNITEDNFNTKYIKRCENAIYELKNLKDSYLEDMNLIESERIAGKIQGVNLAISYFKEMIKEG